VSSLQRETAAVLSAMPQLQKKKISQDIKLQNKITPKVLRRTD